MIKFKDILYPLLVLSLISFLGNGCAEPEEAEIYVKYVDGRADENELKTLLRISKPLSVFVENMKSSEDENAQTAGAWLEKGVGGILVSADFIDIPTEAEVTRDEETVKEYVFQSYFWDAETGDSYTDVKYGLDVSGETWYHTISIREGSSAEYTTIAKAGNASQEDKGYLIFFPDGNEESPLYVITYTVSEDGLVYVNTTSGNEKVSIVINRDYSGNLTGSADDVKAFVADWNPDASGGSYTKFDESGNELETGDWYGIKEDLSLVSFSILDMEDLLDQAVSNLETAGGSALEVRDNLSQTVSDNFKALTSFFIPPGDALVSNVAITGKRWSRVYTWTEGDRNFAYQVSVSKDWYFHQVFVDTTGEWEQMLYGAESKIRNEAYFEIPAENYFTFSYEKRFELTEAGDMLSLVYFAPFSGGINYHTFKINQDNYSGAYSNVYDNLTNLFEWFISSWSENAATGSLDQYTFDGGHQVEYNKTW